MAVLKEKYHIFILLKITVVFLPQCEKKKKGVEGLSFPL